MSKSKKENKGKKVKEEMSIINMDKQIFVKYSEPLFNEKTQLWEVKKTDQDGNELDLLTDSDKETLIEKKEELIKNFILSQVNKQKNESEGRGEVKTRQSKKKNGLIGIQYSPEAIIEEIVKRKLEGENLIDVIPQLAQTYNMTKLSIGLYVDQAMDQIKERAARQLEDILETHLGRYEMLYKWFKENGYLKYATKTLKFKENLMGIGQENRISLEINNVLNVTEDGKDKFSLDKLSKEQKQRMLRLVNKIKNK